MLQSVLDLVFPPTCVACGRIGRLLCIKHLNDLTWKYDAQTADWIYSAVEYRDSASELVKVIKYDFAYRYCKSMAQLMAISFPHFVEKKKIECLIPVPLHKKRQLWRGFNQAKLLAEHLGKLWNIPVDSESLIRNRYSQAQASKNLDERGNVAQSFLLLKPMKWRRICLIDDVVTTGSTLSACRDVVFPTPTLALTFAREH